MKAFVRSWRVPIVLGVVVILVIVGWRPILWAQTAEPNAILGKWEADDGSTRLDIYKAGDEYRMRFLYGRLSTEADGVTMKKDRNNPNPALRGRSLKNIDIVSGLRYRNGAWSGGSIYDASAGSTYNCEVTMEGPKMLMRGYFVVPMLGRTRMFHRMS